MNTSPPYVRRASMHPGSRRILRRQERFQPAAAFEGVAGDPELLEQEHDLEAQFGITAFDGPRQGLPEVRELTEREVVVRYSALAFLAEVGRSRHLQIVRRVAAVDVSRADVLEPLCGKLADRLEHEKALAAGALQEAGFDERVHTVERCIGNVFGCPQGEGPSEDGETREQLTKLAREQVVAPLDRCPKGSLSRGRVATPARENGQSLLESPEQGLRSQRP
jgi:hypothetical protein